MKQTGTKGVQDYVRLSEKDDPQGIEQEIKF